MLSGKRIMGHVLCVKPGHGPNTQMAVQLKKAFGEVMSMTPQVNIPTGEGALDINEVMKILPHRYPFLLLDRIIKSKAITNARESNLSQLMNPSSKATSQIIQ